MDLPRNILNIKDISLPSQCRSWWQKPRHTLLGLALESTPSESTLSLTPTLRRVTPTKLTAGPLCTSGEKTTTPQIDYEKWIIKLEMENETDRQITRHLLPTRMCFNLLTHRTKILKFIRPTMHTLAIRTSRPADQYLPKSAIILTLLLSLTILI